MASNRRVTQRDVALAAGVDVSTVSLALRNHQGISAATRTKIQRCAEELGYRPDPMLAALASYRSSLQAPGFQGSLAFLGNFPEPITHPRAVPHFRDYYEGARKRAADFGFQLDNYELRADGISATRMTSIFQSRNITGVLVSPQPETRARLDFAWERFSAVTFGYSLETPRLHVFTSAHFQSSVRVMRRLLASGYRRIGFALSANHDDRVAHNYLAGYFTEMQLAGLSCPPLHDETKGLDELRRWITKHRLDAVVSGNFGGLERYRQTGFSIPEKLGVVCPSLCARNDPMSGIYEESWHIGVVALEFLIGMINRREQGAPERPQRVLVEGSWNEGTSVRASAVPA